MDHGNTKITQHHTDSVKSLQNVEVGDPVVHVRVLWIISGNTKITQHALKVLRGFRMLKLDTVRKTKQKDRNHASITH